MTDRELLELAAKAAAVELEGVETDGRGVTIRGTYWQPLHDDGDALRLAVKLEIQSGFSEFSGNGNASWDRGNRWVHEYGPDNPYAATRRAIVRAAAEIGRGHE